MINPRYEGEKNFSFIEEYKIHGEQTMNREARQQEDAFVSWRDQKNEQSETAGFAYIEKIAIVYFHIYC